MFSFK